MDTKTSDSQTKAERVSPRAFVAPAVDIFETSEGVVLFADVPGITKEQLTIQVDKGELSLHGKRHAENVGARLGREYGEFDYRRTFVLPEGVDASKIEAKLAQGVLELTIPKSAKEKPRTIEIKAG